MRKLLLLGLLALAGSMQAQGLSRLARVKPGATVIVGTTDAYGSVVFDRCKLLTVDATTLSCVDLLGPQGRLAFPLRQVDAVYEIHKNHGKLIGAIIGLSALAALLIAGGVTGNPGFFLVALIGSGVVAAAAMPNPWLLPAPRYPPGVAYPGPWGIQPWEKGESGRLVYARHAPLVPVTP